MSSTRFSRASDYGATAETDDRRRTPVDEEFTPPQEVSDPRTREDETSTSLRQRIKSNATTIIAYSILGIIGTILIIQYGGQFAITLVANPLVQAALAVFAIFAVGHWTGFSRGQSSVAQLDDLTLYNPESGEVLSFKGRYTGTSSGDYPVFEPVKGLPGIIRGAKSYDADELLSALPSEADARIRTHPGASDTAITDWGGQRGVQITAGLEADRSGQESNIEATLSTEASEKTMANLVEELKAADDEIAALKSQVTQLQRQLDDAHDRLGQPRREMYREMEDARDLFLAFARRDSRTDGDRSNGADLGELDRELREAGDDAR